MAHPDFIEGVEKQLAKPPKPKNPGDPPPPKPLPIWNPQTLEEMPEECVEDFFRVEEGSVFLDLLKRGANYLAYPHGWLGLPAEHAIKSIVDKEDIPVEHLAKHMVSRWSGKVGVKEKVEDVISRKITRREGSEFAVWKLDELPEDSP